MARASPAEVKDLIGTILLRRGYTAAFFVPGPIADAVPALSAATETFLASLPEDALHWESIGASAESWRAVGKTLRDKWTKQLSLPSAAKRDLTSIEISGAVDEGGAPDWGLTILGNPVDDEMPDEKILFEVTFPAVDFSQDEGEERTRRFLALAEMLPYDYAYLSLSLLWSPVSEDDALMRARALAIRYPAFDVAANRAGRSFIGDHVRGARWITLLASRVCELLGGTDALVARGATAGLDANRYGRGIVLRAGALPPVDSVESVGAFDGMRAMARLLEPITLFDEAALIRTAFAGEVDEDDFLKNWERRFL